MILLAMMALPLAGCGGEAAAPRALGEDCDRTSQCAAGARCREAICVDAESVVEDPEAGEGETECPEGTRSVDGACLPSQGRDVCPSPPDRGVGAPCRRATECGDEAICLRNQEHLQFPSGYCSIDVGETPECCPEGTQSIRFASLGISPCLERCVTDADCRRIEGYFCAQTFGLCFPPPHDDCGDDDPHCHQDLDGTEDSVFTCGDGYDNDGDGLIDCDDDVCVFYSPCTGRSGEGAGAFCMDGRDNDGDGRADCDDEECAGLSGCAADG